MLVISGGCSSLMVGTSSAYLGGAGGAIVPCPAAGADSCEGGAVEGGADGGRIGAGGDAGIGALGLLGSCV